MQSSQQVLLVTRLLLSADYHLQEYLRDRDLLGPLITDEVHGTFRLGLLSSLLLQQPELRRLSALRQLGCSSMVFQNADHNRLQHSRGVAFLAFRWGIVLARQQQDHVHGHDPATWLTPLDLELIEVAGLCHDLGHGPFSHVFEANIVPLLGIKGWHHEHLSSLLLRGMLQRLLTQLGLVGGSDAPAAQQQGQQLLHRIHGAVTDLIRGDPGPGDTRALSGYWASKRFVLQIVASAADADKGDYLPRDIGRVGAQHLHPELLELLGGAGSGQLGARLLPLIDNSRLVDGHVCFAARDQHLLQLLYRARCLMHQHVYQHAAVKGFELMVAHVLQLAAPRLSLEWLQEFSAVSDPDANSVDPDAVARFLLRFRALRDSILDEAHRVALHHHEGDTGLARALAILGLYEAGRPYCCVEEEDVDGRMAGHDTLRQPEAAAQAIIQALISTPAAAIATATATAVPALGRLCRPVTSGWFLSSLTTATRIRTPCSCCSCGLRGLTVTSPGSRAAGTPRTSSAASSHAGCVCTSQSCAVRRSRPPTLLPCSRPSGPSSHSCNRLQPHQQRQRQGPQSCCQWAPVWKRRRRVRRRRVRRRSCWRRSRWSCLPRKTKMRKQPPSCCLWRPLARHQQLQRPLLRLS